MVKAASEGRHQTPHRAPLPSAPQVIELHSRHQTPHPKRHRTPYARSISPEISWSLVAPWGQLGRLSLSLRAPSADFGRSPWSLVAVLRGKIGVWWRYALAIAGREGLRITPLSPREIRASG
jgi:hypothetical protein